jgi:hypothetical protein
LYNNDKFGNNIIKALEAVLDSGSQTPGIEIYTELILADKEFVQFGIQESIEGQEPRS